MSKARKKIRDQIRQARKKIPASYARQASFKFSERIAELETYRNANSVAGFLPFDGEADPRPLMERAILEKKSVFVPVIVAKATPLKFAPWTPETKLKTNSFGIEEPDSPSEHWLDGSDLDCVITPLVAFDESRNRIGVGGGFYDRTFEFLKSSTSTSLIGIAYELQKLKKIETEAWDVPLSAIVTELAVY